MQHVFMVIKIIKYQNCNARTKQLNTNIFRLSQCMVTHYCSLWNTGLKSIVKCLSSLFFFNAMHVNVWKKMHLGNRTKRWLCPWVITFWLINIKVSVVFLSVNCFIVLLQCVFLQPCRNKWNKMRRDLDKQPGPQHYPD